MIFLTSLWSLLTLLPAATPPASTYLPENLYLVHAKTVRILQWDERGTPSRGRFLVTRVYLGPVELKGREFECETGWSKTFKATSHPDRLVHFVAEGVEGLWWLYHDPIVNVYRPELRGKTIHELRIQRFPIQNHRYDLGDWGRFVDVEPRFQEALASWAKPVEAIAQAKSDDDRLALLQRLAANPKAPAAAWAVVLLGGSRTKEAVMALRELAGNESITLEAQYALDEALCRRDGPNWFRAERRKQMLARWLNEARLDSGGEERLMLALGYGELDYATYIALVEPCFAKLGRYSEWQQELLARLLGPSPQRAEDKVRMFAFLTPLVRNSPVRRVREAASHALQDCRPLTEEQTGVVRELRDAARDPLVIKNLDWALRAR